MNLKKRIIPILKFTLSFSIVKLATFFFLFILTISSQAQNKKPKFTEIKVNGYFRSYLTYRNMSQYYADGPLTPKTIIVNGVYLDPANAYQPTGYREPMLMINFSGKPTSNTSFEFDYLLDNQMSGEIFNKENTDFKNNPHDINDNPQKIGSPRRIQNYRWINLAAGVQTKYGQLDLKVGGVIFVNMAPSIMSNFVYRDDMFERYPWEWQTISFKRYESFFNNQSIATDSRFGSGSIQGVSMVGTQLPGRFGFAGVYGKTNTSGGFQSFIAGSNNNQDMLAIQISKNIASHQATFNLYDAKAILDTGYSFDNSFKNILSQKIYSSELKFNFTGFTISSEWGTGSVLNPVDSIRRWDPIINVSAVLGKELSPIPLSLQYFHIGSNVVNLNSAILNSSNRNVQSEFGNLLLYNTNVFEGAVGEYGQMTNNRMGVNLATGLDVGRNFKINLALSSQQELENLFDTITFQHRLNAFTRSQFLYYRNGVGPYGRHTNAWRRSWEKLSITDTTYSYKKGFNLIDVSTKLKLNVLNRPLILSNYINYNSVQDKFSALALFDKKAFLRNIYEEFMAFYNFTNKVTLVTSFGVERVWGNQQTALASNGKPMDQTGYGLGLGLDFDISASTGLYLRQKWYSFSDANFVNDKFYGYDTNIELKIFF